MHYICAYPKQKEAKHNLTLLNFFRPLWPATPLGQQASLSESNKYWCPHLIHTLGFCLRTSYGEQKTDLILTYHTGSRKLDRQMTVDRFFRWITGIGM